jgi:hypothetical protein
MINSPFLRLKKRATQGVSHELATGTLGIEEFVWIHRFAGALCYAQH